MLFISYRYILLILKLFTIKDVNIDENKIITIRKICYVLQRKILLTK